MNVFSIGDKKFIIGAFLLQIDFYVCFFLGGGGDYRSLLLVFIANYFLFITSTSW